MASPIFTGKSVDELGKFVDAISDAADATIIAYPGILEDHLAVEIAVKDFRSGAGDGGFDQQQLEWAARDVHNAFVSMTRRIISLHE